jgi:geranylgeranyl reductase family protein
VTKTDVVVAGAGPAGAAAAITLARLGRRVTLVDKARFPRDKCCGDGLTTGALRRLESLGLDPSVVPSWEVVERALLRVPDGNEITLALPTDGSQYAASARRMDLDAALVDLARTGGVDVREGSAVTAVAPLDGGGVRVDLGGEHVDAWYAIGADGMWSPVRRSLGLEQPGYLGDWHAARQYVRGVGPLARQMWVWFEEDLLPGYAWSFPLPDGTANIGFGIRRVRGEPTGQMKQQWDDVFRRSHIAEVLGPGAHPEGPWKAWPIPAQIAHTTLSGLDGRVLFVGDAARASDPMTGEGIAQALETGELAARAVAAAGPERPAEAAERYGRQVRWGMAVDDRLARALSRVLARRRGANGWLPLVDTGAWTRRSFARWMFEDYPRALPATPQRWRRGALRRPGAFADLGGRKA